MPNRKQVQRIEIDGTPMQCLDAIADFETYPQWQETITQARIVDRHPDGRGRKVDFTLSVMGKSVKYSLEYEYDLEDDDNPVLAWTYAGGDLKNCEGSYSFSRKDGKKSVTEATYSLTVDPGFFIPGFVVRTLNNVAMKQSMQALKARVEKS